MTKYALYLEGGPRRKTTMVHVLDLLGCTVKRATTDEAIDAAPDGIRAFQRFLKRHDPKTTVAKAITTEVAEHVMEGYFLGQGSLAILFEWDRQPLTAAELKRYTQRLTWMHADLHTILDRLPKQVDEKPDADERALGEILGHMASTQATFLWGPFGHTPVHRDAIRRVQKGEAFTLADLDAVQTATLDRLANLTADDRALVKSRGKDTWTPRKTVRRLLEHQWEHLEEIARRWEIPLPK